nr:putative ribonuclease H-like domain-containing protein [Tanacetum cinerariifolium]
MMDYGYNFMQTKVYVDNESAICVIKNPVYHSKTKHIVIMHHFIRDSYEKRLIEMVKIHTDHNIADLLTKAFDVGDEAVHKELGDIMERVATTASSLEAEQDSEQFWQTAALSTIKDEVMDITATIDRKVKVLITEASIRRHLKLKDSEGLSTLPTEEIFEQLALMGVHSLGHDEGSLSLHELTILCTSLSMKVKSLENDLRQKKKVFSSALTKLILRVKRLERTVKTSTARRKARIVSGQPKEQLGIFSAAKVLANAAEQGRSDENVQTYTRRRRKVSTASRLVSTASEMVCTAGIKAKDKGKVVMQESKPSKKIKKRIQVQMSIDKELAKADQAHDIDWSDPTVIRYHALQNRPRTVPEGMSYEDIRPIFKKVWDQIHSFVPTNSKLEVQRSKRTNQEVLEEPVERQSTEEKIRKKNDDSSRPTRKKTLAKKRAGGNDSEESMKKQKPKDDTEKKELKAYLDIVPEDEFVMEVESLATKQDVMDLHRLVEERYTTTSPEAIHMMIEKKYPLNQEMISKMLSKRLEVAQESKMAIELLRFTRLQEQKQ